MKKQALWIAPDGKKFRVKFTSKDDLMEALTNLRNKHGYPEPEAVHAMAVEPGAEKTLEGPGAINTAHIPEDKERELVQNSLDNLAKPDPRKLN